MPPKPGNPSDLSGGKKDSVLGQSKGKAKNVNVPVDTDDEEESSSDFDASHPVGRDGDWSQSSPVGGEDQEYQVKLPDQEYFVNSPSQQQLAPPGFAMDDEPVSRPVRKTAGIPPSRFPAQPDLQRAWLAAVERDKPVTTTSRICSAHFNAEDFWPTYSSGRRSLRTSVVPTIFTPTDNLL
ncbi:hypothetical protein GE061_000041 [Apolygus lucorum]|uniref:THAP-type domain-containing protein n=1 Tax=Apolygus lucorum TaxID=248454 RepID=A0A8S9Y358_APOLU|nr:hypothetical protein GE061_000041 [Apolygus lucorum]